MILEMRQITYIRSSPWRLDLHGVTPEDKSAPDGRFHNLYWVHTLTTQTYTESLLNDESALDGRSNSLYQAFTLSAQTYTESLMNDWSAPDGRSDSLYRVLTLIAQTYTESLWMTEALLMVALTAYSRFSLWQLRPIRNHSWMMKALLTVTPTTYIGSSPWRLDLHGGSLERQKCSWRPPI